MNIALVLSGGVGSRMGSDMPKQYLSFGGKMMITKTLESLYLNDEIQAVQIVAFPQWHSKILEEQGDIPFSEEKFRGFSEPGENRQLSILHGLRDISRYGKGEDTVMVQDAVRPLVKPEQVSRCLKAISFHDGVMPVLPMKDTVYLSSDGKTVSELLERNRVFAGQAPEFFRLGKYIAANEALLPERILRINGSTEPAILAGMDIAMVPGDEDNFKISTKGDLERYRGLAGLEGEA